MTGNRTRLVAVAALLAVGTGVLTGSGTAWADSAVEHHARFLEDGVRIRSEPFVDAQILGQGDRDHQAVVHCWTEGTEVDHRTVWYRLTDRTTDIQGYSHSDLVETDTYELPRC